MNAVLTVTAHPALDRALHVARLHCIGWAWP
jgi:hypothetical protein